MREGITRAFLREKEVGFQLLSRHHALVKRFLEEWKEGEGPLEAHPKTRNRLSEAGEKHDGGKLQRFSVRGEENGRPVYSFKGHRFDIPQEVQDPYVRALIRGHHDYSTLEVVGAAGRFQDPLERERFSEDLYLLMMADQLEAELMVRVYEGKEGEVRPFVEFDLEDRGQEEGVRVFQLDPWPFCKEYLEFDLEAYFHPYQAEEAETVKVWGEKLARAPGLQEFRLETHRVKLIPRKERGKALPQDPEGFYRLFSMDPTPFQREVWKAVSLGHPAHLVPAPTGTGKTEAAAFPALSLGMRLIFALPARSLVDDLEDRFAQYLRVLAQRSERPYRLLVDTDHRQVRRVFHPPDGWEEIPKERHLYKADVVLTTLDKLLYRYFSYASRSKGYVFPRRIRDGRTLFVFDEAHAYEATAWANFKRLVAALHRAGVAYLVMTATMPKRYQKALTGSLEGAPLRHPKVARPSRVLHYCPKGKVEELAREHFKKRKRVLVVEEVKRAAEIYLALKERFTGEVFLYHGRQAETVRREVFEEVKKRDRAKKPEPYLLVTTPAIEAGVDLDAEVLITELCPPERLLQRLGRLNRRGKGVGEAYVVGTAYPEYLGQLPEGFTELLRALDGQDLKCSGEERILEAVDYPDWSDPRAQTLFEALHEYVYGLDPLNEGVWRKGFIATRGWEPSVTLRWKEHGKEHEVSVNVGLLATGKKEDLVEAKVCQRVFPDREEGSAPREVPLRFEELYLKDVVVDYPFPYDPELGFVEVPKVFLRCSRQGEERVRLCYEPPKGSDERGGVSKAEEEQSSEVWVWYLAESARPLEE